MFAKIRITLSLFGLLGILAACSAESRPPWPTSPTGLPRTTAGLPGQNLAPTATLAVISSPPRETAGAQTGRSFDCQDVREIPAEECQALLALYESTEGGSWEEDGGWLVDETPCNWYGVRCQQGHVVELQLFYNHLNGSLPPEMGNLSYLRDLYLDGNQLSGPLPPEIGKLERLRLARLGGNRFNSLPANMANLKHLVYLELWGNQLGGKIPGDLGNLSRLQELKLGFNQFTGSIPPELGKLAFLHHLDLSHNQLSGSIPAELADLRNLNQLDLSFNQLSGPIPVELEGLSQLYWFDLSYNNLTGAVPAAMAQAPLSERRLWGNLFDGTVLAQGTATSVEYQGVRFAFDSALARSVWPERVAAQPTGGEAPVWLDKPEHVRFTFAYPREPGDLQALRTGVFGPPQILIFPTETYSTMSELAREQIDGLEDLLETRPPVPGNDIPLLPLINAAQVFHARVKYLDFENGRGVRFITQYSQDVIPITNQNLTYSFQGLTRDGAYYVAAYFPVAAGGLSDEISIEDWESFREEYEDYLKETTRYLDALSSQGYEPGLERLDGLIQSLVVNPP